MGCQRESSPAQEQMTAGRAPSQLPSPGPLDFLRAPAFCWSPLLGVTGWLVHRSSITRPRAPRNVVISQPHAAAGPEGHGRLRGLSLLPVAPSLVTLNPLLSWHPGPFLYPQPWVGWGPAPLWPGTLRDGVFSPPTANQPRGPCCEHVCLRGHAVTPKSSTVRPLGLESRPLDSGEWGGQARAGLFLSTEAEQVNVLPNESRNPRSPPSPC